MKLTADAAAFHFLDVEHMLGELPDLFFTGRQIVHQAGFLGRHQTALSRGGEQFLFARQPFVEFRKSKLNYARRTAVFGERNRPAGFVRAPPCRVEQQVAPGFARG